MTFVPSSPFSMRRSSPPHARTGPGSPALLDCVDALVLRRRIELLRSAAYYTQDVPVLVPPPLAITLVHPNVITYHGGQTITVTGTGFVPGYTQLYIGGTLIQPTYLSEVSMRVCALHGTEKTTPGIPGVVGETGAAPYARSFAERRASSSRSVLFASPRSIASMVTRCGSSSGGIFRARSPSTTRVTRRFSASSR